MGKDAALPTGFEDLRGRVFQGHYELDEIVYASPWRVTYAGRERNAQRGVVLELIRPSRRHDQATLERFERRVAACKRVRHSAVVSPIDAGELADGTLWVIGERPAGEPLAWNLQRQSSGRLDWIDARPLLLGLVRGIGAAHARRVVHGSLNPICCWVDRPEFGAPVLRVSGFGVNTNPASDDAQLGQSRTIALAYDAVFMAPETVGGVFGDERADAYLVGLVAWVMLVGRPPFQAANPFQTAGMHLTAPLPALRDVGVDAPPGVEELLRSMLSKNPAQRIGVMSEVEQALLGLDEGGHAQEAGLSLNPDDARGRRGRARARQAGASSREQAVQRLAGKGNVGGSGRTGMPRLSGQEIVDAQRRGAVSPRPQTVSPPQPRGVSSMPSHSQDVPPVPPHSRSVPPPLLQSVPLSPRDVRPPPTPPRADIETTQHIERLAPAASAPGRATVQVETTQHIERFASSSRTVVQSEPTHAFDRFVPSAAATPAAPEPTEMLAPHELADVLWSGPGHDLDEARPDATVMLLAQDPAALSPSKTVRVIDDRPGPARSGSTLPAGHAQPPPPAAVPVVSGQTVRMTAEQVRMMRLAGLVGGASDARSTGHAAEPGVEPTQMLDVALEDDMEDQQTTTLSPEQVRALRRALGKQAPGEE